MIKLKVLQLDILKEPDIRTNKPKFVSRINKQAARAFRAESMCNDFLVKAVRRHFVHRTFRELHVFRLGIDQEITVALADRAVATGDLGRQG